MKQKYVLRFVHMTDSKRIRECIGFTVYFYYYFFMYELFWAKIT